MTAVPGTQRVRSAIMESVSARPVSYLSRRVYLAQFRPAFSGTRTSERDRAFADLLISTGMRINEANSLLLGDLPDPDAPEFRGKKTVPLSLHRGQRTGKFASSVFSCTCFAPFSGMDGTDAAALSGAAQGSYQATAAAFRSCKYGHNVHLPRLPGGGG